MQYYNLELLEAPKSSASSFATPSATPQLSSYPRPPRPYAWITHLSPPGIFSFSSLMPPLRVGLLPTISRMTLSSSTFPSTRGNAAANVCSSRARVSGDGSGFQSLGSFVPPMTVPPSKPRGMQNDQAPSAFCLVMVAEHVLSATRQVWPMLLVC